MHYLGRGWTFDDINEQTAISKEFYHTFLRAFINFGSTSLYSRFVLTPLYLPEARSNMWEYAVTGFQGCVGSTDCTHITTERCKYWLKNNHPGTKSSHTTRTFNLTCNHCRWILHTTTEGPGWWNDQTMVHLDKFISGVRDGNLLQDNDIELLDFNCLGNVISVKYNGVYVIVDNGYLPTMVVFCSPLYHHQRYGSDTLVKMAWKHAKRCRVRLWNFKGKMANLEVGH